MVSETELAFVMARAGSDILSERLGDFSAEQIVLSRKEAALCLGIIAGAKELLEREAAKQPQKAIAA